jgi:cold shock protein
METLRRFGFTELRPGQTVQVRWGFGSKGCMAAELRPDGPSTGGIPSPH